jgi:tetratricopeptide (TPR) repeat protein
MATRDRMIRCLAEITVARETAGDLTGALAWARRWSTADSLDEDADRAVMRIYARLGRHAAALDHFRLVVDRLQEELGIEPEPETRLLEERIRVDLTATKARSADAPSRRFAGRDHERTTLLTRLDDAARGEGGLVVVTGEAGIGKTRLLEEIAAAADWRGWQVSWGRGEEFGLPGPYAPLADALREATAGPRREQLRLTVEPVWLAVTAGLVPDLASAEAGIRPTADRGELVAALERVLDGLAAVAPQLILLDDVQWADPEVWPLLAALHPTLARRRVLIVLGGRIEELRGDEVAWASLEAWDREGAAILHLRGLDLASLATLAGASERPGLSSEELEALARASGGNPLIALALLHNDGPLGEPTTTGPAVDRHEDLVRLFGHRLAALSKPARLALEAAAVAGQRFSFDHWQAVAGSVAPAVVGELERSGLVVVDRVGHAFVHDTLRSLVVWNLTVARRQQLDRAALASLARRSPDNVLGQLFHAERLDDRARIADLAERAGRRALDGLAFAAAVRYFGRALDVLPADARGARYAALLGRVRALDVLAERDRQRADLSELADVAVAIGDDRAIVEAAIWQARFHWAVGEYGEAERVANPTLGIARRLRDRAAQAALLTVVGRIRREQGRHEEARSALERALSLSRRIGDRHAEAMASELLAGIAWRTGNHALAATQHRVAAEMFERAGDPRLAAHSLNSLGTVLWSLGDYTGAEAVHERSLATCRALGDRRGEANNLDNLGGVAWALGDYHRAIERYSAALAIRREAEDPWGVSISLTNLADTYRLVGDWERSLACFDEALAVDRRVGVARNTATALQGKGATLFELGRLVEARELLEAAQAIHIEVGDRDNLGETRATLTLVELGLGQTDAAHALVTEALSGLGPDTGTMTRQWVHYAAYVVATARGERADADMHLALARDALEDALTTIPSELRPAFLATVPLNRLTLEAGEALSTIVDVRLARRGARLGRRLADEDLVIVRWTIDAPSDAATSDPAERRRAIIRRLLAEAEAQGAVATDGDIARALGVSRRTILRDMTVLTADGARPSTRRRAATRNVTKVTASGAVVDHRTTEVR